MKKKLTINNLKFKKFHKPLICLTAYTTPIAQILDKYCDVILVGDSLGMVLHGMKSTREVTLEMMIMHGKAARRGIKNSLLVVDMPIGTYEKNSKIALRNAKKIMKETNCDAVKVEGGIKIYETIKCLVRNNIPVMGHVGLLPQSVKKKSDYRVKGKDNLSFTQILKDSISIEKAGAFALVVELSNRPADIGQQQYPSHVKDAVAASGKSHGYAPGESDAQIRLREGKKAFGQRVSHGQKQGDQRQSDGVAI